MIEKVGQDVGVRPPDLVWVFEVLQHTVELIDAMAFDDGLALFFCAQVHAHTGGIGLGVKLGADHIIIEPEAHNGPLVGHMGAALFDAEDAGAHLIKAVEIGLYDLVVAAVHSIEGISEALEYGLFGTGLEHVDGEDTECGGAALAYEAYIEVAAGELEGMADEEDVLLAGVGGVIVPADHTIEPAAPGYVPVIKAADEWIAGATGGDLDIV